MAKNTRGKYPIDNELEAAVAKALNIGVPVSRVCREAEVDQSTLWKWRNGKSSPTMATRQRVLDAVDKLVKEALL